MAGHLDSWHFVLYYFNTLLNSYTTNMKIHICVLGLDNKHCRLVTGLLIDHCTLRWHLRLYAGNVARKRNPPTTYFVSA
jgi:hypothetical protein